MRLCVYVSPVTEDELKRRTGEFDLEVATFLDLSDLGQLGRPCCVCAGEISLASFSLVRCRAQREAG